MYTGNEPNSFISQYWQDAFENSVSCMRNQNADFVNHNFATTFWWHLANICRTSTSGPFDLQSKIKYVSPNNSIFGAWEDGFADVILNIDSGSGPNIVTINPDPDSERNWNNFTNFTNDCTLPSGKSYAQGSNASSGVGGTIEGWDYEDFPSSTIVHGVVIPENVIVGAGKIGNNESKVDDGSHSVFDNMFKVVSDTEHNSFTFNTIVVLYDIYEGDQTTPSYTDIPMGIFFTGLITAEHQGGGQFLYEIQNPVTIYKSSEDTYGAGTGWSLRICTRFSTTPQGLLKVEDVALTSDALDNVMSAQMSAVAELIRANRKGISKTVQVSQNLYNIINQFTDTQKTNIPYVVDDYWYVNGSNTGTCAVASGGECTIEQIENIFSE